MGNVVVGMTVSLDGFINDGDGSLSALYSDFDDLQNAELMKESIRNTGAVVMGWRTFNMAKDLDSYAVDYEYQVPIFVVTHKLPLRHPKENDKLKIFFVTDGLEVAIARAKQAAQQLDVTVVGGAKIIQQCLAKKLANELQIDVMPILLGNGQRLFDGSVTPDLKLKKPACVITPAGRTHFAFLLSEQQGSHR